MYYVPWKYWRWAPRAAQSYKSRNAAKSCADCGEAIFLLVVAEPATVARRRGRRAFIAHSVLDLQLNSHGRCKRNAFGLWLA